MDGTPTLRMNEFILSALAHNKIDLGPAEADRAKLPQVEELVFEVNGQVNELVKGAEKRFDELVGAHDLHVRVPMPYMLCFSRLLTLTRFSGSALRGLREELHQAAQDVA